MLKNGETTAAAAGKVALLGFLPGWRVWVGFASSGEGLLEPCGFSGLFTGDSLNKKCFSLTLVKY